NALPFGVWVRDADDRVVLQNSVDIARYGDQWGTTLDTFPDIATCDLDYHRIKAEYAIGQFFTHETVENLAGKDHYFLRIVAPLPDQDGQNGMFGVAIDITDLKQTELALQESERLLSMALSAAKAGVWEWNMLTQSAYWSDENFRLLGYEPGQVEPSYDQWLNAIHPEDRERTTAHVAEVLTNLNEMNLEFRVLLPDGTIRWISNIGRIMFDDQNHPISLTGIQIDITDRKCIEAERQQAEIALRQSEERWQLAIEGSNDGIWDHNLITGEHFLSPRCMEILGYDYEEIDSFEKWMDQIHPDDQPVLQTTFQAYLAHKTPIYAVEYRIRCQDGSYKWLLARGKAFWDETGTPLRAIGSMSDITLRKQAETTLQHLNAELEQRVQQRTQDLQQAYARLQDSEARFQTFMNNSPTVSWISKTNGVLVYVSQNYYRTFELQAADAVGQSVFELYPPAIAQPFWHDLQTVIQTHQVLETVRFMPRADGTVGEFLMYKFPLSASSGQPLIGGIAIDITEHRQAEAAIRRSQEQLQLAVEGSGDGLWDWNIPTGETYLSPRWLEMLGYQPGDLPLTIQAWEDLIHPEDYAAVMAVLDAHLRDGSVPYQVEFRARSKPGEWRWILDYGKVVSHTDTGEP
ncbi:MAG TPA: PAS domain-containing protein, partial [Allocoleopsis sp.]